MASLWRLSFRKVQEEYSHVGANAGKKYIEKVNPRGPNEKHYIGQDGTMTVLEKDIKTWWDWGVVTCTYAGEMDDSLFKPVLAEPDFVDEQIRSKKNGDLVGYQG